MNIYQGCVWVLLRPIVRCAGGFLNNTRIYNLTDPSNTAIAFNTRLNDTNNYMVK